MISSSEKTTAASGVLNAAAIAAAAPTGMSALTCSGLQPEITAEHRGYPAADLHRRSFASQGNATGQSRCRAKEFSENRTEGDAARPAQIARLWFAAPRYRGHPGNNGTAGTPCRESPEREPARDARLRCPRDKAASLKRSVTTMNATTAKPVRAPITSVSTRNTCSSRLRMPGIAWTKGLLHQRGLPPLSASFTVPPSRNRPNDGSFRFGASAAGDRIASLFFATLYISYHDIL